MIQRIQTVYFFVALVLIILPLFGLSLYIVKADELGALNFEISAFSVKLNGVDKQPSLLWIYSLIPALGVLLSIFLFKDRKKQALMARVSAALVVFASAWIYYTGIQFLSNESGNLQNHGVIPQVAYYCFVASIVFILLGLRGVNKDKKLIDSLNRLR